MTPPKESAKDQRNRSPKQIQRLRPNGPIDRNATASGVTGVTVSSLQSLDRAVELLQATAYSQTGLRLTELAKQVGLSTSTAHRILSRLVAHHLLHLSPRTKVYTSGIDLYRIGQAASRHFPLLDLVRPSMRRLAEATGDTIYLSIINGEEAICIERMVGSYPIKTLTLAQGDRRPLGVGAGAMALLAALPDARAQTIIEDESARSRYSGFQASWLKRAVAETRRRGYAFNPGRILKGMSAIGVSLVDAANQPICALSIAAISSRMAPARRTRIAAQLQQECATLSGEALTYNIGGFQ